MTTLSIEYDAKNEGNVFSKGDSITGRLVVETSKSTKVEELSIKVEGKAHVRWTEHYGKMTITYNAEDGYFSFENIVLQEQRGDGSNILTAGRHVFPFTFEIPDEDLPTSFKGKHGKIVYSLKAKLTRSMRMASKTKTKFTVVSKADMSIPDLMKPQQMNEDKDLTSGKITMNVHIERLGYLQGEALKIRTEIANNSTKSVTPKYYLYEKQCFYGSSLCTSKRKVYTKDILKEMGESVLAKTQRNMTHVLNIPADLTGTISNCSILTLEYRLKVVLDLGFTKNLVVKLPVVVLIDTDGSALKELQEKDNWFKS